MVGIGTALLGMGISFVKDLIMDNGEDLVKEGIKKVTGIDLTKKKPADLTPDEIAKIKEAEAKIRELDFKELQLKLDNDRANRDRAHETYAVKNEMADKIAEQIIRYNLPVIFLLVLINVVIVHFLKEEATLIAIASNIIGVAIGNLFSERQAIVNFFFGSSIGSKHKSKELEERKK